MACKDTNICSDLIQQIEAVGSLKGRMNLIITILGIIVMMCGWTTHQTIQNGKDIVRLNSKVLLVYDSKRKPDEDKDKKKETLVCLEQVNK